MPSAETQHLPPLASSLHLELTSRCLLACPACPRTQFKGQYEITDLPLASVRKLIHGAIQFRGIILCGDHGDPIYHPEFHEVLRVLLTAKGAPPLRISTNGCYQDENWWRQTAELLRPQDSVIFGLDGLADTSKLYRKNSDWHSAVNGMRTLKQHGRCKVTWQWILFKFNQEQLGEARRFCEELKIDEFIIVESFRDPSLGPSVPTISITEAYDRFQS